MYYNELYHHGIKGQRWGIRRYQNEDGTLTPSGKKRYDTENNNSSKKDTAKIVGAVAGGVLIGAAAIGAAWYLKNRKDKIVAHKKNLARAAKAAATRKANSEIRKTYKDVDVMISKGSEFIAKFDNVKIAKLVMGG